MLEEINETFDEGCESVMMQLATGAGKTAIAAEWSKALGGHILFLAPALSIIGQAPDEFAKWNSRAIAVGTGYKTWKYADKLWSARLHDSVVASTATTALNNIKNTKTMQNKFSSLIVDEAHHAPDPIGKATQITRVVQMARRAGLPVLGMTATPWRLSKRQGFEKTWDVLICGPSWNALKGTYLADIHMIRHGQQIIVGAGSVSGKDYTEGATWTRNKRSLIFTKGAFDMLIQNAMQPDGLLSKTIMYAIGQKHAVVLSELAYGLGIKTGVLISDTKLITGTRRRALRRALKEGMVVADRHEVNRRFRSGDIRLVINVNMVTEGYDLPDCAVVIILRPTMSLALWLQMCGRGSRITPGKDVLTLIDLTDNYARLGDPLMERGWSLSARMDDNALLGDPVLRFCSDDKGESCNTMIYAGQHICPHCSRVQGTDCDTCGKFRLWKSFATSEGYRTWICDLCRHEEEIPSALGVDLIHKGWTRRGDLYYRLMLSDGTYANVLNFQRGTFMR